jgi:hypothetical protein
MTTPELVVLVVPSPHEMVVPAKSDAVASGFPSVNVALVLRGEEALVCCGGMGTAEPAVNGASVIVTDSGLEVTVATLLAVYACNGGSVTVTVAG